MITRKTTRIIGIALIVIGLSVFGISYNQGSIGQDRYSNLGCVVTDYEMPNSCTIANNQTTGGSIGMIFAFFTALFGASLVIPSVLVVLVRIIKKLTKHQVRSGRDLQ
ncbi:MAG: hypothetical protein WCC17_20030 [Candidatus Nitrosopolaris sp.]